MRINQFVSHATGMSRRAADSAIQDGRVTVGGRVAVLGEHVEANSKVLLDGQPLELTTTHTYIMLNKPAGYVSSRTQQGTQPTLYDLLPPKHHRLRTVGRLDRDSSGLILLTDDGDFTYRHTHPSHVKLKVYELNLARPLTGADRRKLESGVNLTDGPSRISVLNADGQNVTVSLSEGRNRQLRRTFGALGYTINRLHRVTMGDYKLGNLPEGEWRVVSSEDTI